jgi:hypothetical protein
MWMGIPIAERKNDGPQLNLNVRRKDKQQEDYDEETIILRRGVWKTGTA